MFCFWGLNIWCQNVLSPEDAVLQTLANNFNIRIAQNDVSIAANNTDKALFGYNPTVTTEANLNGNINNNTTKFTTGESIVTGYGLAYGANANIGAAYNIIDPTRKANWSQAKEQVALADIQKQLAIQNNVANTLLAYYDASRASANISVLNDVLSLSQERLERLKIQNQYGQANRLDMLNAQVDIDRDSINMVNAVLLYENAIRTLNNVIGIPIETVYMVSEDVSYRDNVPLDAVIAMALENSLQIKLINQNQLITELSYDIIDANRKPVLGATANYNFNFNRSAPGSFFSSSRSDGLGVGLSLRYNLYDGGVLNNQKENTKLLLQSQSLQRDQLLNDLIAQLTNLWHQFQNAQFIIQSEQSNVSTTQVNFERTKEVYEAGQATSIEFREAQINMLTAENSLLNARYDAKLLEIQMRLLSGKILEE